MHDELIKQLIELLNKRSGICKLCSKRCLFLCCFSLIWKLKEPAGYGEPVNIGVGLFERTEGLWLTERF